MMIYNSDFQSVLRGSERICDQLAGDPWIYFCHGCIKIYLFLKLKEKCFVKNNCGTPLIGNRFILCDCYNI
jgi:hypothetical protein